MLILLWGIPYERPLAAVARELGRLDVPTVTVDQREVLGTEVELRVDGEVRGWVRMPGQRVDFDAVTAVYARPYDSRCLPDLARLDPDDPARQHALLVDSVLWSWLELTPARVVNRPEAMASNGSKPYQLELIREHGFHVPETLVTTDPAAVRDFHSRHGSLVYKSISGMRSIVSRLRPVDLDRLADVAFCPTQFQEYVAGTDYRVHVVGEEVFASEIASEADDYRYPLEHSVEIRAGALPDDVEERCRRLSADLGLAVSGVDLRRSAGGEWYCFEVNPSPAFTYYQEDTGQPISLAIARLLAQW